MKLSELINIEYRFLLDQDSDPATLRKRDRDIGLHLYENADKQEIVREWLGRVQTRDSARPGETFATGMRWLRILLVVLGLAIGGTTAATALAYDGQQPVNIVNFLAVILGVQGVTILLLLLNFFPRRILPFSGNFLQFVREAGLAIGRRVSKWLEHLPEGQDAANLAALQQLRKRQGLYANLQKWLAISLTQRFGLAFNLGALAVLLGLVAFSDLAFAWNTTLKVTPQEFHRGTEVLAAPWKPIVPEAAPSLALIEETRWYRLTGAYQDSEGAARTSDAARVGDWWRFLMMAILVYGLAPRLLLMGLSGWRLRSGLNNLPLKAAEFQALFDRLFRPLVETRTPDPESPLPELQEVALQQQQPKTQASGCHVILWGELEIDTTELATWVQKRYGWRIITTHAAGALDVSKDESAIAAAGAASDSEAILLLAEAWEAPGRAIQNFLRSLRSSLNEDRELVVGLLGDLQNGQPEKPTSSDWQSWTRSLNSLSDPYLRVTMLAEG